MFAEHGRNDWYFVTVQRLVPILVAAFFGIVSAIYSIGESQSWPYEDIFTDNDLNPCSSSCLLGVSLKSSYTRHLKLLHQHPLLPDLDISHPYPKTTILKSSTGLTITIVSDSNGETYLLQLELPPATFINDSVPSPELGHIVSRLGQPQWVAIEQLGCTGSIILGYGELRLVTRLVPVLRPTTKIQAILLRPSSTSNHLNKVNWKGFAPIWRYGEGAKICQS